MSEAERLRDSAAMVQRLADQQTTIALRNHLLSTARGWRRMAEKAEAEERFVQQMEAALPVASISSQAA